MPNAVTISLNNETDAKVNILPGTIASEVMSVDVILIKTEG
jgi:hypothetical protein